MLIYSGIKSDFMLDTENDCLGTMYSGDGEFTKNIDVYGGEGTAVFVDQAIQIYCDKREAER